MISLATTSVTSDKTEAIKSQLVRLRKHMKTCRVRTFKRTYIRHDIHTYVHMLHLSAIITSLLSISHTSLVVRHSPHNHCPCNPPLPSSVADTRCLFVRPSVPPSLCRTVPQFERSSVLSVSLSVSGACVCVCVCVDYLFICLFTTLVEFCGRQCGRLLGRPAACVGVVVHSILLLLLLLLAAVCSRCCCRCRLVFMFMLACWSFVAIICHCFG